MRAVVQRVKYAKVKVHDEIIGQINEGILLLLGVEVNDNLKDLDYLADKCVNLRIFEDEDGKMNKSLIDVNGSILVVSQFTLHGDARKGRRPSFITAAGPDIAVPLYESFLENLKQRGIKTENGQFGADMQVELLNDGPVTILLDSKKIF
jgi:D-tyrosyl-tRNA(Tyr) deacylase